MCPEEIFQGKYLSNWNQFFSSVWEFELLIFRILAKNVANITKAAFYVSILTNCHNNVLVKKNSNVSDYQGKNLRFLVRNCWHDWQTFFLSVQRKILRKQNLHKRVNHNHFLTLGHKVWNLYLKPPSRAVRTAFYVSRGWFPGFFLEYIVLRRSRTPSSKIRTFSEEFYVGLSFMHFTFPKSVFGRNLRLISGRHILGLQAIKFVGLI